MKIEVLFPEFCNLFGDAYNMVYLEKTLPEAEFIRTKFSDDVRFTEEKMNLVYMGPMTERMQEQVIRKLMPLKEKIQKAIDKIDQEAEKEAAKEYKAKLATAKADAEEKTKAAVEKLEQEKADLKRQLDSSATKLDAAVRQAKAAGADTDVAACRVYFTELQQTAAKVQELIGKINAKDPATGAKLSAAVIQVLQSTARNLEVAQ